MKPMATLGNHAAEYGAEATAEYRYLIVNFRVGAHGLATQACTSSDTLQLQAALWNTHGPNARGLNVPAFATADSGTTLRSIIALLPKTATCKAVPAGLPHAAATVDW